MPSGWCAYGNQTHLNGERFKIRSGIDIVHVPFKSGSEMLTAGLANQVQLTFADISTALPLIEDRTLKALAVATEQRSPLLPELPTVIESGVSGFVTSFWTGMEAPAGTPKDIVDTLNRALCHGLTTAGVVAALSKVGATPTPRTPADFTAFVASEAAKWSELVIKAGIKLD